MPQQAGLVAGPTTTVGYSAGSVTACTPTAKIAGTLGAVMLVGKAYPAAVFTVTANATSAASQKVITLPTTTNMAQFKNGMTVEVTSGTGVLVANTYITTFNGVSKTVTIADNIATNILSGDVISFNSQASGVTAIAMAAGNPSYAWDSATDAVDSTSFLIPHLSTMGASALTAVLPGGNGGVFVQAIPSIAAPANRNNASAVIPTPYVSNAITFTPATKGVYFLVDWTPYYVW